MLHLIPAHQGRPSDDPIFALNSEATARRAKGESIVNATVGALLDDDGKLAILPSAARAVHDVSQEEWAAYAPIAGTPPFLEAVMDDLLGSHPSLRKMAVAAATPGGTGALRHAIANFLEPGQALLTTHFYWGPYQTLADEAERRVITFNMFEAGAGGSVGGFDVTALDRALDATLKEQGRALLFLNDPCHNPTGYSMSRAEWEAVVSCISKHAVRAPVTVLLDVAYAAYAATDPRSYLPLVAKLSENAGLVFAWSASKAFTHYGLRVGAVVACVPDEAERTMTANAFSYSCRGTWSNCSRGGLSAVTRLLTDPDLAAATAREREGLKALLFARVQTFNRLAQAKKLRYPRYEGGFFVTVLVDDAASHAKRMKDAGVFVVPQKGAVRVALCSVADRDIPRLVDALAG